MISQMISSLVRYGIDQQLIESDDAVFVRNQLLMMMNEDDFSEQNPVTDLPLHEILNALCDEAVSKGILNDDIVSRDLFDTKLMGCLTPWPHEVRRTFNELLQNEGPSAATDWYYSFSKSTNYIRSDRIAKDIGWKAETEYGNLDITINLSKPEKDPKAIAAAKNAVQTSYPKCQLCSENEGYAGRLNHPARQNHRIIPIELNHENWYLQYSPYVYYNEHCIVFHENHIPMKISADTFRTLLDFVKQFPHYFIGSNADLPIVGGSILTHEHFQGGRYTFAMAEADIETEWTFEGYEDVRAGIVHWPMSVIRLISEDDSKIAELSSKILDAWRSRTDEACGIYAETEGTPHNTITPICRRRNGAYEMDLVLRNNRTDEENPLGIFHPHAELHHIKKENIGLIEVMGLAVLPGRLKKELDELADALVRKIPSEEYSPDIRKHCEWASEIAEKYEINEENVHEILRYETGKVFARVLEDAGVYKKNQEGHDGFIRFLKTI